MSEPTTEMPVAEAVAKLDAIEHADDPEAAHAAADGVLLEFVPPEVAQAWERAEERCGGFWYA